MSSKNLKIGLISDTHSYYDTTLDTIFHDRDEIWHAGDIGSIQVIAELEKICPVKAVFGNIDDSSIANSYPEDLFIENGQLKIFITHIAAKPPKYNKRVKTLIEKEKPKVLICGHSHLLKVEPDNDNDLLFINPGAAGQQGFHAVRTVMLMEINDEKVLDLKVVELGKRGRK